MIKAVRRVPSAGKKIYLTFDDGPVASATSRVLDCLEELNVPATFFVVAERARENGAVLREILARGHAIGNHSLDHGYKPFFQGKQRMLQWIRESEEYIAWQIGRPTVGFRPPAGIRTPELHWALEEMKMPLVLWQTRFYDTRLPWTRERALRSMEKTAPGDIILLHDRQSDGRISEFLNTLQLYIETARRSGLEFSSLSREICRFGDSIGKVEQ